MANHYVTFGQKHIHTIDGKTLDKDTVAVYQADSDKEGREKAFQLFGPNFFTDYHDTAWKEDKLQFFPKGYLYLE